MDSNVLLRCRMSRKVLRISTITITWTTVISIVLFYYVSNKLVDTRVVHGGLETSNKKRLVYSERLERVRGVCKSRPLGLLHRVYVVGSSMAYCPVAKIGSTFWKQVYLFLNNDTGTYHPKSPSDIPRSFVHYGKRHNTRILNSNFTGRIDTKFMFVRNPFSRLWSTYLDKFYLPDFWRTFALVITKRRRNFSGGAHACGNDVSFYEFLTYVVSLSTKAMNEHWKPIKQTCDPCKYKPDFIGKMETFEQDARHILKKINKEWFIDELDHNAQTEKELSMLIDYNFQLVTSMAQTTFHSTCTSKADIGKRLWHVFQLNGYLPINVTAESVIAKLTEHTFDRNIFKKYVLDVFKKLSPKERERCRLQKKISLKGAYSQLPESLVRRVIHIYADDFQSYGYDVQIPGWQSS